MVCHHDKCNSNRQLHLPSDCTNLCCDCTLPPDATTSRQFVTSANEPAACRLFDRLRLITPFMDTHTCSRMPNPRVYVRLCPNCYLPFLSNTPFSHPSALSPFHSNYIILVKIFTKLYPFLSFIEANEAVAYIRNFDYKSFKNLFHSFAIVI